ncbi:MAG: DUF4430 domain-containing protein [Lachnospiraceae bacterium]|nr:DUF4430 domain-containing protein [Lachnospiraceae bacterium]
METKKTSNKKVVLGLIALVAVIAVLGIAYAVFGPKTTEGAKAITIEVIDNEQKSEVYELNTDAEYLRQALEEAKAVGLTVTGTESEYGLTIITVNGVTADFNVDSAYWSITVNGEYGMLGADSQPVTDGDEFQLVYTVY